MLARPALSPAFTDLPFYGNKILIIPPKLTYRDTYTERELPPGYQEPPSPSDLTLVNMMKASGESPQAITALMTAQARQTALQNRFEVYSVKELSSAQPPEARESMSELEKGSKNLLKGWSKDREHLLGQLRILKKITGIDGVVVQSVTIKIGGNGQWNSASGQITAGTSSSTLKAGLIATDTGDLIWERESFYRDVPDALNLNAMLTMLFQDFPLRKMKKIQSPVEEKREP